MRFDVHVLSCRASFGCVVWISENLIAFLIDCLAFVRSVPVGTVCVVFGATHAGAGFAAFSNYGVEFGRVLVASVNVACEASPQLRHNAIK